MPEKTLKFEVGEIFEFFTESENDTQEINPSQQFTGSGGGAGILENTPKFEVVENFHSFKQFVESENDSRSPSWGRKLKKTPNFEYKGLQMRDENFQNLESKNSQLKLSVESEELR